MDAADAYIEQLIAEKRQLQQVANLALTVASQMQQLADAAGAGFGVPPLAPSLPLSALEQIARDLGARLTPPNGQTPRALAGATQEK